MNRPKRHRSKIAHRMKVKFQLLLHHRLSSNLKLCQRFPPSSRPHPTVWVRGFSALVNWSLKGRRSNGMLYPRLIRVSRMLLNGHRMKSRATLATLDSKNKLLFFAKTLVLVLNLFEKSLTLELFELMRLFRFKSYSYEKCAFILHASFAYE